MRLRSGVTLAGQGRRTVLRHAPGGSTPSGYHNYGMHDAPLEFTDGLALDDGHPARPHPRRLLRDVRVHHLGGAGLGAGSRPALGLPPGRAAPFATSFPLIYAENARDVAVRSLTLDGNRAAQPVGIGACRGAALYLIGSDGFTIEDVHEEGFAGEGLGFQMCAHGEIRDCRFTGNAGNGYHPGAGSTGVLFERCASEGTNWQALFLRARQPHHRARLHVRREPRGGRVRRHARLLQLIEDCDMRRTRAPASSSAERPPGGGALATSAAAACGQRQDIGGPGRRPRRRPRRDPRGLRHRRARRTERPASTCALRPAHLARGNRVSGCFPDVVANDGQPPDRPAFDCGRDAATDAAFRHLGLPEA